MTETDQELERLRIENDILLKRIAKSVTSDELTLTRKLNDSLRKALAESDLDCVYCGLPAKDIAKCAHGFPGCGRADDMTI